MSIASRTSDLMACLAGYPEWAHFRESLGRLWSMVGAVIHENNALRCNNERLVRENAALLKRASEAEASARTARTMASHWRIEARGGDYDATQEDPP